MFSNRFRILSVFVIAVASSPFLTGDLYAGCYGNRCYYSSCYSKPYYSTPYYAAPSYTYRDQIGVQQNFVTAGDNARYGVTPAIINAHAQSIKRDMAALQGELATFQQYSSQVQPVTLLIQGVQQTAQVRQYQVASPNPTYQVQQQQQQQYVQTDNGLVCFPTNAAISPNGPQLATQGYQPNTAPYGASATPNGQANGYAGNDLYTQQMQQQPANNGQSQNQSVIQAFCIECHNPQSAKGELDLSGRTALTCEQKQAINDFIRPDANGVAKMPKDGKNLPSGLKALPPEYRLALIDEVATIPTATTDSGNYSPGPGNGNGQAPAEAPPKQLP